jgi:hypothetical protein
MSDSIEYQSEAFSCTQKNRFAVLTLKEKAFKMVSDLNIRSDYFSVLSTIEKSSEIWGLLQINSNEYFGSILVFDFRIAAEDTTLVFPGIQFGFPPSGPLVFYLPRFIGYPRATEILLSAKPISASEAFALGLVTSVVPYEKFEGQGLKMLEKITKLQNSAISTIRCLLQPTGAERERFLERSYNGVMKALIKLKRATI